MSGRRENDITAPDGYILGGLRQVRKDGTILFQRGWWQAPAEWAGDKVWVHERWVDHYGNPHGNANNLVLEAAHPGLHIYDAQGRTPPLTVICQRTKRPDAKPVARSQWRKDWLDRNKATPNQEPEAGEGKDV